METRREEEVALEDRNKHFWCFIEYIGLRGGLIFLGLWHVGAPSDLDWLEHVWFYRLLGARLVWIDWSR